MEEWKSGKKEKLSLIGGIERWRDEKLICLIKKKNEKIENIVVINSNAPFSYGFSFFIIPIVRTGFGSNPKTGMDLGPTSPNNKFIESGRKS